MEEPIESLYFKWLCAKVLERNSHNYRDLLRILYKTEFVWVVPADRHRVEDGIELRYDFLRETNVEQDDNFWEEEPCSVLELFISFAKRALFQTDISVQEWFWEFITNLKLDEFRQVSDSDIPIIENILNTFIWRTYNSKGHGGMFPLSQTKNDQREVEIWYQFCEYLDEHGLM